MRKERECFKDLFLLSIKKSGIKENQTRKERWGKLKLKATPKPLKIEINI